MSDESMSYVGKCRGCGQLVYASVICFDDQERRREQAKDIAGLIKQGFSVEQMTVEQVRQSGFVCKCPKPPKKIVGQTGLAL